VVNDNPPPGRSWVDVTFGWFDKGEEWLVAEQGQWAALAVARWRVSSSELEMQGMQGRALDILHRVDDQLWLSGSRAVPDRPPESGEAAVEKHEQREAEAAREAQFVQNAARVAALVAENAAFLEDAPKQIKRRQKALRQALSLRERVDAGDVTPDADQVRASRGYAGSTPQPGGASVSLHRTNFRHLFFTDTQP
jgi:hypothetical protein